MHSRRRLVAGADTDCEPDAYLQAPVDAAVVAKAKALSAAPAGPQQSLGLFKSALSLSDKGPGSAAKLPCTLCGAIAVSNDVVELVRQFRPCELQYIINLFRLTLCPSG